MATVSIEFSVYSDPRYKYLGQLTRTDQYGAIGRMSALWMHCIDRNTQTLKKDIINVMAGRKKFADAMVEAELAEPVEGDPDRVRIKGTEGRIEYLAKARERQKVATEAARQKRLKDAEESPEATEDATFKEPTSDTNLDPTSESIPGPTLESNLGPTLDVRNENNSSSSTSSSTSSYNTKNKESIGATAIAVASQPNLPGIPGKKPPQPDVGRFIGTYIKAYQNKYGAKTRPDIGGKVQGQIKKLLEDVPIDRACALIQVYCQMEDPWFKTKCHDFVTFKENLNKVSIAFDNGEDPSVANNKIDWSKVNLE